MKRIVIIVFVLFSFILSAWKTADYFTKEQMQKYSASVLDSYNWNNNYRLCLADITGWNIQKVIDTSNCDNWATKNANYQKWVKEIMLKNKGSVISWLTDQRINEMLNYINEEAITRKMSKTQRDSLFTELKTETNYYLDRFAKLQSTTSSKRQAIFTEAAKISPRHKAYQLSGDGPDAPPNPALIKVQENLRQLLSTTGITLKKNCDDFLNYQFTRHSRQYDYLFSTLRWATYIDEGKITETEITGWTEPTIKALINDEITFIKKVKKVIDAYKVN